MSKVILTGDRPTGRLHVGHYVGSLKRRVELQNSGKFDDIYIMIADAQALTDNADNPEKVRQNIVEVALDYLACGLDPAKSVLFIQSMVPELTELSFYYMNLVTVSRLQRNPTVKSEIQMRNFEASIPVGFFTYPISQAADITAFKATTVPVGEDQMPMIEQTREIVHKFNTVYGETLVEPEILLPENKACLRLPGTDGKAKMSKSLGNIVSPDDMVRDYGCDALRMYELFIGPPELDSIWDDRGIDGVYRFLNRFWKLAMDSKEAGVAETKEMIKLRHKLVYDITQRLESFSLNTVISGFMEYNNKLIELAKKTGGIDKETIETFVKLLAPFAPHITEELWAEYGHTDSVFHTQWPAADEEAMKDDEIEIPVQINGKTKVIISISAEATKEEAIEAGKVAVADKLTGNIIKEIYVPKKIINIVMK